MPTYNAQTVRELIAADATLAPLAANGDWTALRAAIEAKVVTAPGPVPLWQVKFHLFSVGVWQTLPALVATNPVAAALLDFYNDQRFQNLDPSAPAVAGLLDAAVVADGNPHGIATRAQIDALIAMGATSAPWFTSVTSQPNPHEGDLMVLYGVDNADTPQTPAEDPAPTEGDQSNGS